MTAVSTGNIYSGALSCIIAGEECISVTVIPPRLGLLNNPTYI